MDELPLLPGYRFPDRTQSNFLVPRTLAFQNGHRIVRIPRYGIGQTNKPTVHLTEQERDLLDDFQPELIYGKVRVQQARKFIPESVRFDKKVLRLYGYFKEIIRESPLEHYRVRRVILAYYLEDDTMSIYEIPYENSALPQGMRVHRHRIAKNNRNDFYNWRDLNLGENLVIYGTNYRICDCDQFTREWLESEGIELKCSELIPVDPYAWKLMNKQRLNTKNSSSNSSDKQYHNMEGKVLRFYAVLDDPNQSCSSGRKFLILVYLIDHTIELREIHQTNNGYDHKAIYLHRQIVPKDSNYNIKSFVNLFVNQSECEKICYLKADDFHLNHRITIFNQVFLLYDCDSFTRDFYEMNVHH